ncbi:pimeloyl-ACP methyl ester carboxylesterase [Williamsia limnetica]|uniref:Pimeloyl-ACP methyl ester carboxylesterase n=1 Tax=Williamsia limnetica TaxID=882452 RepID=A0A318RP01_WILLI|nr:alpha/beta hydrolase [Williamsia limnetica]PYE20638.1 pimeloyl-ACP methyl ester carboxylesterase [Williamsia limnetica]
MAARELDDVTPRIAETAAGPVEYVDLGGGPPIVFIHGSPGGCDQGALMTQFMTSNHRVVSISRPGYLRTPLTEQNRSPQQQAALVAALLSELEIERFALMCWSGGGPVTYTLAARYPERVTAVVAVAAVSTEFNPAKTIRGRLELGEEKMLFGRLGTWFATTLAERAPATAITTLLSGEGDLTRSQAKQLTAEIMSDDIQRAFATALFDTVTGPRKPGFENDFEQFKHLDLPLAAVSVPALLVHSRTDADVPYAQSVHAAGAIPNSQLITVDVGTHLSAWLGPDAADIQSAIIEHFSARG